MKLAGDVSKEDRELAEQLDLFEQDIGNDTYPNERKAQLYACLAHDWYQMGMEEEGNRLLLKAEKVFPGYFKDTVIKHQLEDDTFDLIIKNITSELARMLVDNVSRKA